ncbi:MAG: sulfotransferase [Pseudomonadota bacterium]
MSVLKAIAANPALMLRHRNIFLLSHMRANTSLFGHLLGSHPQVEGYYEMHIGYYSWKSLWRQKLRHFAAHQAKPGARYMFDKVLHDGHAVAPALLQRPDSRTIMMLREPVQSIKSLVVLYRSTSPQLPEATPEGAARYYIDRLATLAQLAPLLQQRFFYLDAECLVQDTAPTLAALGDWLALDTPIPTEYQTFSNTGRGNTGDTSSRLKSGKVSHSSNDYSGIVVPSALMQEATQAYRSHRATLLAHSQRSSTLAAAQAALPG